LLNGSTQGSVGVSTARLLKVKRREWVRYHNTVSQWEIDHYLALF
jgi:glutamine synthetase